MEKPFVINNRLCGWIYLSNITIQFATFKTYTMCEVATQSFTSPNAVPDTDSMALASVDRYPGPLECGVCSSVWTEPITLPCGHTYCKKCVGAEGPRSPRAIICKQCGKTCVSCCISNNILLANVTRRWFAQENCSKEVRDSDITERLPSHTKAENYSYVQGASEYTCKCRQWTWYINMCVRERVRERVFLN